MDIIELTKDLISRRQKLLDGYQKSNNFMAAQVEEDEIAKLYLNLEKLTQGID